ncbi:hypothetical protein ACIBI9_55265 [Nonomuraea sp. NPDC050451]|uniref:hypothetical protein n=1 Tax=Nonomuraea sp. NPDC050451 TaxID=3364364 RepID=UPI0037944D67
MSTLAERLHAGLDENDIATAAAIELLNAEPDYGSAWLDNDDFVGNGCVRDNDENDGKAFIDWRQARVVHGMLVQMAPQPIPEYANALALLDFAIALGEGRYRFNEMGHQQRSALATATARLAAPGHS